MRVLLTINFVFFSFISFGQAKRALNLIEKQKYETAFKLLSNSFAKDTISASIPFALAKLYLVQKWSRYQLDTAFYFSTQALHKYNLLPKHNLHKHIKDGFNKSRLLTLKKQIDSISFENAKNGGKEIDYQIFINTHIDADQLDLAIYLRNEQAYLIASTTNTLASYQTFLEKYPTAANWDKANAKYQKILYQKHTSSGNLQSYKIFVEKQPSSPYLEEAIFHIYDIEVGRNNIKSILNFIAKYPNSKACNKAIGLLYHKHLVKEKASFFTKKYPKININDSLKQVIKNQKNTILPIWDKSHFQIIDLAQKVIIDSLSWIDKKTMHKDFLAVETSDDKLLLAKNGNPFYQNKSFSFLKEEQGFIFLKRKNIFSMVHKNGDVIDGGDDAYLIGPFIAYKKKKLWGLKSITNLNILAPTYDSIWTENKLLFLSIQNKTIIFTPNMLYPALDKKTVKMDLIFDDYEWLSDSTLWIKKDGKEGLFSNLLKELVPIEKHHIDPAKKGEIIYKNEEIYMPTFSDTTLTKFNENEQWQIGNIKDSLIVKYRYKQFYNPTNASLLGSSAIIMHWKDSVYVYLSDTLKFLKPDNYEVKPLLDQNNKVFYYELVKGKRKILINRFGKKINVPKYIKVIPLNKFFFQLVITTSGSKRLYSSSGELIISKMDGASLINEKSISIFKNKKFGLIQPFDSVNIIPIYSKKMIPIADSLWVVSVDNKFGVINSKSDTLLSASFDEIYYWTNALILAKSGWKWNIYDLKVSKFVVYGIVAYSFITKKGNPKIIFQKGIGVGVFDSDKGIVLKPTYTNIFLEGTFQQPYYRAEKYVEEAGLHIMLYYKLDGKLLFHTIMDEKPFHILYGDDKIN